MDVDESVATRIQNSKKCFQTWVSKNKIFWKRFSDFNGYSIFLFSEPMAIIPYLLRSLRIQKMFKAREIYCQTGTIPKQMIRNWNETRIMKIMLSIVFVVGITYSTFGMLYTPDIIDTIT